MNCHKQWLKATNVLSHCFCRSGDHFQIRWVLCSGWSKGVAGEAIASEAQGSFKLIQVLGRIQNWVFDWSSCVLASCCLLFVDRCQQLKVTLRSLPHGPSGRHCLSVALSTLRRASADASWSACGLTCWGWAHSLFSPFSWTQSDLKRVLNYVCKIPFSIL